MASDVDQVTEPSEAEVIFAAIGRALRGVHTVAPGKVVAYDNTTQTATIELTVQFELKANGYEAVPPLLDVPIVQPTTSAFYLHIPLLPGDAVTVLFFEQDPTQWFAKGLTSAPAIKRRHGFYPVALLGPTVALARLTALEAPTGKAVFGARSGGPCVACDATGVQLGALIASTPVALATALDTWTAALVSWLSTHVHTIPPGTDAAGGLTTTLTSTPPAAPTTAATKVKAV